MFQTNQPTYVERVQQKSRETDKAQLLIMAAFVGVVFLLTKGK